MRKYTALDGLGDTDIVYDNTDESNGMDDKDEGYWL